MRPDLGAESHLDVEAHVRPSVGASTTGRGRAAPSEAEAAASCAQKAGETRPLRSTIFLGVLRSGALRASDPDMSDAERRARAEARRARGVTVERMTSLDETSAPYAEATVEERLTAMTRLCRAAWLATGRSMPLEGREHRASQPGEVYWPDHATRARAS